MLVLFLCIVSQDVIPNVDSTIKRFQFPFCFLCLTLLTDLLSTVRGPLTEKQEGENKTYKFFQSDLSNIKNLALWLLTGWQRFR